MSESADRSLTKIGHSRLRGRWRRRVDQRLFSLPAWRPHSLRLTRRYGRPVAPLMNPVVQAPASDLTSSSNTSRTRGATGPRWGR